MRRVFCFLRVSPDISQGADADDFNPGRFIDADGEVTPALADTKDCASVIRRYFRPFLDSYAFRFQKVIVSLYPVLAMPDHPISSTGRVSFVSHPLFFFSSLGPHASCIRASDRGMHNPNVYVD